MSAYSNARPIRDTLGAQQKSGPDGAGNTVSSGPDPYEGGAVDQLTHPHGHEPHRIDWSCHRCQLPIRDHDGYLYVDTISDTPPPPPRRGYVPTLGELLDTPTPEPWRAAHAQCMPEETVTYTIAVERLRTPWQLLAWTAHIMAKPWAADGTDWLHLIETKAGVTL